MFISRGYSARGLRDRRRPVAKGAKGGRAPVKLECPPLEQKYYILGYCSVTEFFCLQTVVTENISNPEAQPGGNYPVAMPPNRSTEWSFTKN